MRNIYFTRRMYRQYVGAMYDNVEEAEVRMEAAAEEEPPLNEPMPVVLYGAPTGARSGEQEGLWTWARMVVARGRIAVARARMTVARSINALIRCFRKSYSVGVACISAAGIAVIFIFLVAIVNSYIRTKTQVHIPEKIPDMMIVVPKAADEGDKSPVTFKVMDSGHYKDLIEAILAFLRSRNGTVASGNGSIN